MVESFEYYYAIFFDKQFEGEEVVPIQATEEEEIQPTTTEGEVAPEKKKLIKISIAQMITANRTNELKNKHLKVLMKAIQFFRNNTTSDNENIIAVLNFLELSPELLLLKPRTKLHVKELMDTKDKESWDTLYTSANLQDLIQYAVD